MSETIPKDLHHTKSHTWVRALSAGIVEVGITGHAQGSLGDMVSADVPDVGRSVIAGESIATVESNKAASDVPSPVSGKIRAANSELADSPELLNQDPYGKGWLFQVQISSEPAGLLSAADYEKFLTA